MEDNYIGENIRIYRERRKLTQQQLADKVGVSWEMISRYERAASSPLSKIHRIADALDVKESQLLEEHIPHGLGFEDLRIPLFVNMPSPARFVPSQTHYFYISPEWIVKNYRDVIAIDTNIVKFDNEDWNRHGILFVTTDKSNKKGEYVILKRYDSLYMKRYTGNDKDEILGIVLAQEIRHVSS